MNYNEDAIFEEMREQEAQRLNLIIHGIQEFNEKTASGEKRIEWEQNETDKIFKVLELSLTKEDIKFCRRVGEKSESPRALIVGFYTKYTGSVLFHYIRYLRETEYKDVSVMPTLPGDKDRKSS
jgi:hypothetical protein